MTDNELYRALGSLEATVKAVGEEVRHMRAEMHGRVGRIEAKTEEQQKQADERIKHLENKNAYHRGAGWVLIGLISAGVSVIVRHIPWPFSGV